MQETPSITCLLVLHSVLLSTVFSSNQFVQVKKRPVVKSIKSPDGDIIDCVKFHLQPAFDRLQLRGQMSWVLPELPKGHDDTGKKLEIKQLWNSKGESCPNGTIPIRRTSVSEIKSISTSKFEREFSRKDIPEAPSHEHAIGYVKDGTFYGSKAILNVWKPNVTRNDFSISQIWVVADIPGRLANTVEAGWHVFPNVYKDSLPRLFSYWTPNGYRDGCYNLMCSGFIQTSNKFSLGSAIDPISTYNGQQYDLSFMIWKDPKSENWRLQIGSELMGFWPANLFTDLRDHATLIEYGGEVYSEKLGKHTSTQMGSGHFPIEGFGKAAFARNLQVVDQDNFSIRPPNFNLLADKPECYNVSSGHIVEWGDYIFFGGPGNNPNCP